MPAWKLAAAALIAGTLVVAVAAGQDDLPSRIANDPGNPQVTGATARLIDDAAVQGLCDLRRRPDRIRPPADGLR